MRRTRLRAQAFQKDDEREKKKRKATSRVTLCDRKRAVIVRVQGGRKSVKVFSEGNEKRRVVSEWCWRCEKKKRRHGYRFRIAIKDQCEEEEKRSELIFAYASGPFLQVPVIPLTWPIYSSRWS
jgi:hypothetical protein